MFSNCQYVCRLPSVICIASRVCFSLGHWSPRRLLYLILLSLCLRGARSRWVVLSPPGYCTSEMFMMDGKGHKPVPDITSETVFQSCMWFYDSDIWFLIFSSVHRFCIHLLIKVHFPDFLLSFCILARNQYIYSVKIFWNVFPVTLSLI